jgi:hypothetical protein
MDADLKNEEEYKKDFIGANKKEWDVIYNHLVNSAVVKA